MLLYRVIIKKKRKKKKRTSFAPFHLTRRPNPNFYALTNSLPNLLANGSKNGADLLEDEARGGPETRVEAREGVAEISYR